MNDRESASTENRDWVGWRGPHRDGHVAWLPKSLPTKQAILWSKRLSSSALAGVAATSEAIVVADRDPADRVDIFRCFNADGSERWVLRYAAPGELDYGNSARATPLIHGKLVFLAGAQGHLHAVDLVSGDVVWKKHFVRDFDGPAKLSWGFCSSPLIVEDRLIVQPGGHAASLVALNPSSGETLWKSPGRPPGHSSLIVARLAGVQQLIGYDDQSLGGWSPATGERLWSLQPKLPGDFNVPTPIVWGEKLLASTENNGTRLYGFDSQGQIVPQPVAENDALVPDCHTPLLVGDRLFGISGSLLCLNARDSLRELWHSDDVVFHDYASLIGSPDRVLATTLHGKLILLNAHSANYEQTAELQLFDEEAGLYSHPAIVGNRLYVRGSRALVCLQLDAR